MVAVEIEIGLHRWDVEGYAVELRFTRPDDEADVPPVRGRASFDLNGLRERELNIAEYGQLLSGSLFGDPAVREFFSQARGVAESLEARLRLRLLVGASAPELRSVRWETLRDPKDGSSLLTDEHVCFSRYLSSLDWRPVRLRPKGELRALVVVANPTNVGQYQQQGQRLSPLDVPGELARARASLGDIPVTELASGGSATLDNLCDQLRQGPDILYLVCHGAMVGDPPVQQEPYLWLEKEDGSAAVVAGEELATRLREMQDRPRLVVLASCQSAGGGTGTALGPRLVEAGIPAVVAMQGSVAIDTAAQFMPVFFRELQEDGQIDRAMSVARGAVRDRPDHWMPTLLMRLRSGRIWYVPGFAEDREGFEKWPALLRCMSRGRCTPILGPGLVEPLFGPTREIARNWAETYHFPLAPYDREDLPQVAQYLAVKQARSFPRDELAEQLRVELVRRHGAGLSDDLRRSPLEKLLPVVGAEQRRQNPADPHRVLASLSCPVYITINPDNLLAEALTEVGKEPKVEMCRWNEYLEGIPSVFDDDPDYRPDAQHPLVFHLFGRYEEPDSLVITEDDYFDYLIGVTSNKDLIPGEVRRALADTALLFLGFQLDDWNFRVLFRSIMSQEGRRLRQKYAHVGVQVDPDEARLLEPEGARRYLSGYFEDADISIYWGDAEDFVKELQQRLPGGPQ
jgi:hypothetical protein